MSLEVTNQCVQVSWKPLIGHYGYVVADSTRYLYQIKFEREH